jgi:hypothetical protein
MKYLLVLASLFALAGCEDRYRYKCQDFANFNHPDCQRPKCLFTQLCPDYMVAPILEKQVNQLQVQQPQQPAPTEAAPSK